MGSLAGSAGVSLVDPEEARLGSTLLLIVDFVAMAALSLIAAAVYLVAEYVYLNRRIQGGQKTWFTNASAS